MGVGLGLLLRVVETMGCFFFFLGVDARLWVVGGGGVRCV